jgi:hypothetical protein
VILVAGSNVVIEKFQKKAGYKDSAVWTHVCGCLGGYNVIEAQVPFSRVINLQKEYVDKGYRIKVMSRRFQDESSRYKIALWWAAMNNLPYDSLQFFWFPLSWVFERVGHALHKVLSSKKRFLCSELICAGFYKESDYLFNKPLEKVLPADFDNEQLFEEVKDVWLV